MSHIFIPHMSRKALSRVYLDSKERNKLMHHIQNNKLHREKLGRDIETGMLYVLT